MLYIGKLRVYGEDMIAKTYSVIPFGYNGAIIEIEGTEVCGLPAFNIVGMASKTISEARERVKSAIRSSGFIFPDQKLTINLAPADLEKSGTGLDLPIAINILTLSNQLLQNNIAGTAFVGELSLDGEIRPIHGIINIAESAKNAGFKRLVIPYKNFTQASLVSGIEIIPIKTLMDVYLYLKNQLKISLTSNVVKNTATDEIAVTFADIYGQDLAKRALLIAIAGRHNIILSGPPGTGKTALSKCALQYLPPLTLPEQISVTKIYSLSGRSSDIITKRPFRSPHHTCSLVSLIGGGTQAMPGEISLAHLGVLFLDELLEYPRPLLESLRQPLEDRKISISRSGRKITYPADFMLIATTNPCPCGFLGDPNHPCTCSESQIRNYRKKLSGPLLDRIDIHTEVGRVDPSVVATKRSNRSDALLDMTNAISKAITIQRQRYNNNHTYNASAPSAQISNLMHIHPKAKILLNSAAKSLDLSMRAYFKVIKVAQTIADLSGEPEINTSHISEAIAFRQKT